MSYREASKLLLRQSVLDAIGRLLRERPWAQTTMAEVASAAGISRQTLYNEFGAREQLAQAFVIREGERFLTAVEASIEEHLDEPSSALAAALQLFLESAAEDPLVGMLLADDGTGGMLPLLTTQSGPVLVWAAQRLGAAMQAGWPQMHADDARLLAEALVRLAISYVTAPAGPPELATADAVRLLEPFIARAVADASIGAAEVEAAEIEAAEIGRHVAEIGRARG
ncbi:MAG: TetR family transcriptional regulator [Solirubrobacteraceae bacterium]